MVNGHYSIAISLILANNRYLNRLLGTTNAQILGHLSAEFFKIGLIVIIESKVLQ